MENWGHRKGILMLPLTCWTGRGVSQGVGDDRTVGTTVGTQDIFVDLIR